MLNSVTGNSQIIVTQDDTMNVARPNYCTDVPLVRTRLFGKIWKNVGGESVVDHGSPISNVGIWLPRTSCYGATLFVLSVVRI